MKRLYRWVMAIHIMLIWAKSKPQTKPHKCEERALIEVLILEAVQANPKATQSEIMQTSGKSKRAIQDGFASLQAKGVLMREGSKMNGLWIVKGNIE